MAETTSVLLVDDDAASRTSLGWLLEDEGCIVTEADSLASARRRLTGGSYELVILDVHLGDGDGTSLIPDVIANSPGAKIVVVTGSPGVELDARADLTLLKGMDPASVVAAITQLLR